MNIQSAGLLPLQQKEETVSFHENEIPFFVNAAMNKLYENSFSSTVSEHISTNLTSTYILRHDGHINTIILVNIKNNTMTVLNGDIHIEFKKIEKFSTYIFNRYENIQYIFFQSILTESDTLSLPYQKYRSSEDIVLSLPQTPQTYLAQLGKSTKKYIKYHLGRSNRHFPGISYAIYQTNEISEKIVLEIIDFNTARMHGKNRRSTLDETQKNWLIRITKTHGFVAVTRINGRVCAGIICSQVGKNYFMHVIAHDPAYDEYRLGILCCYRCINEAILRGGAEFHFLWGEGDYKYRLGGMKHDLYNLVVYRSRTVYFLQFGTVLRHAFIRTRLQLKKRLKQRAGGNDTIARLLRGAFRHLAVLHHFYHGKIN
jgi:hypothetical protein